LRIEPAPYAHCPNEARFVIDRHPDSRLLGKIRSMTRTEYRQEYGVTGARAADVHVLYGICLAQWVL